MRVERMGCVSSPHSARSRYFFHPLAAQRAYDLLPDTRILVLLRNPIKRIVSHFNMEYQIQIQQGTLDVRGLSKQDVQLRYTDSLQGMVTREVRHLTDCSALAAWILPRWASCVAATRAWWTTMTTWLLTAALVLQTWVCADATRRWNASSTCGAGIVAAVWWHASRHCLAQQCVCRPSRQVDVLLSSGALFDLDL